MMSSAHGSRPSAVACCRPRAQRLVRICMWLGLLPALACGNVLPQPAATARPSATLPAAIESATPLQAAISPTSGPAAYLTRTPTPTPVLPTATPTPLPPGALRPDAPARVIARQGMNVRETPSVDGKQVGRFAPGTVVAVKEGPLQSGGFSWWRVQSGQGLSGWVADGDAEDEWLTGDIGEPRPVSRPVRVDDRIVVTTKDGNFLALRHQAAGTLIRRVEAGIQFTVKDGPVDAEGFRWWLLQDDEGLEGWAAESDSKTRWLTPLE
jgi:hypothetical protein